MTTPRKILGAGVVAAVLGAGLVATGQSTAFAATAPTAISTKAFLITANYTKYNAPLAGLLTKARKTTVDYVMAHANHTRTPSTAISGEAHGFRWDSSDNGDANAVPQGITTSRDAVGQANGGKYDGHQLIAVSFYDNDHTAHGSRINLTDWDSKYPDKYRRILLVEPTGTKAKPSFRDVPIHVGGLAWYGNLLYVADTSNGMRVFDMSKIIKTTATGDANLIGAHGGKMYAHHYAFALPQVGTITSHVAKGTTKLTWSTISLDRPKKSIVMTEYTSKTGSKYPNHAARAIRFDFAKGSTKFAAKTVASQALRMPIYNLNGVASHNGRWWFDDSATHKLWYWKPGTSLTSHNWVSSGESISYWEDSAGADLLWSLQEGKGSRNVFAVKQAGYS